MTVKTPATIMDQLRFFHSMPSADGVAKINDIAVQNSTQNIKHKTATGLHIIVDDKDPEQTLFGVTAVPRETRLADDTREKGWQKVAKLTVICDTLTIRCDWWLPECDLTVYARRIEFEGDGRIDTSPPAWALAKAQGSTGKTPGVNGAHGHAGGDAVIYVSEVVTPKGTTRKRIITDGLDGQGGGKGQNGGDGRNVSPLYIPFGYVDKDSHIDSWIKTTVAVKLDKHKDREVLGIRRIWKVAEILERRNTVQGTTEKPTNGEPSVAPGDPGNGGAAGKLVTNQAAIQKLWSGKPGKAGALPPKALGGRAGTPSRSGFYTCTYRHEIHFTNNDDNSANAKIEFAEYNTEPGKDSEAKAGTDAGPASETVEETDAAIWLHPMLVPQLMNYVREAYLTEQRDEAKRLIDLYAAAFLNPLPTANKAWKVKDGAYWRSVQTELATLAQRLAARLDYFGKPAGYTPLLSLSGSFQLYRMEVDLALEVLMFTSWVAEKQRAQAETAESSEAAARLILKENAKLVDQISAAEAKSEVLTQRIAALAKAQGELQGKLDVTYTRLYNQASGDMAKIGQIKFAANLAAALCQVVPVGQPILGGVASMAAEATDFLDKDPSEVIKSLKTRLSDTVDAYKEAKKDADDVIKKAKSEAQELAKAEGGKKLTVADIKKLSETKPSTWSTVGKGLAPAASHLKKAYESAQLPQAEIEAQLAKLATKDEAWKKLSKEIKEVIEQRASVFEEVMQLGQQIGQGYADLADNMDSLAGLFDKEASARSRMLNANAFTAIDGIRNRARISLTEALYNVVRAFESTLLKSVRVNWSLDTLYEQVNTVLSEKPLHKWTDKDVLDRIKTLKPLFKGNLAAIREGLVKDVEKLAMDDRDVDLVIDGDTRGNPIAALNDGMSVEISTLRLGAVEPDWQRQMMADIRLNRIQFEGPATDLPDKGDVEIIIEIGELGIVRSDDQLYGLRLPVSLVKSYRYHFSNGSITKAQQSALAKDLMSLILDDADDKIKQKMAMPAAWTTLTLKAAFNLHGDKPAPRIRRIDLTMIVSSVKAKSRQVVLDLAATDGFSALSVPALSAEPLVEAYHVFDGKQGDLTISVAEPGEPGRKLDRWVIRQGGKTSVETGQSITLPIDRNTRIEAVFGQ
ncbi:hypothetical protein GCM10009087_09780 [Sphingomonas oligophenolica]|uniref:Uncharacterized protein n=1 Tax=Sphingomonas oligophenolica TaxID=301154 RepID=A0ABU9Y8M3_9SPHN